MFNKYSIGVFAENKENYITFNIKVNINKPMVTNKDSKKGLKNINSVPSLERLTSNLMINFRTLKCFTRELF